MFRSPLVAIELTLIQKRSSREQWLPDLVELTASLRDHEIGVIDQTLLHNCNPEKSERRVLTEYTTLEDKANMALTIGELIKVLHSVSAIDAEGQAQLQPALYEEAHNLLAGGKDVKPDQLISLLRDFHWLESNEVRLVRDILQYMNEKASLDDQKAIVAGLKDKHPAEVSHVLTNPLKYPELEQYIVLATYQVMKPTDKGNNR